MKRQRKICVAFHICGMIDREHRMTRKVGINCQITLPDQVRVDDVAKLIGIYAGLPKEPRSLQGGSWCCHVDGINVESIPGVPHCARIRWDHGNVIYHFEWDEPGRGIMPDSTPFWIAAGRRLVEFFGGSIVYRDVDKVGCDFSLPWQTDCHASDGLEWSMFQERLMRQTPLSFREIARAAQFAAYKDFHPFNGIDLAKARHPKVCLN